MLGQIAPTPYDLRFSLFGIPIRVHPFFWVVTAAMGWRGEDFQLTLIWVACVFVSILVHELGHALAARFYGYPPEIVLYHFGGYAAFHPYWGYTTSRAIQILLAGPGAGFVLYGVMQGVEQLIIRYRFIPEDPTQQRYLVYVLIQMEWINLWWGLVNLLPVFPLDGGQISRHLLEHFRPRDGWQMSLKLSLVTAIGMGVYCFQQDLRYAGIMFGLLAISSLQALQER